MCLPQIECMCHQFQTNAIGSLFWNQLKFKCVPHLDLHNQWEDCLHSVSLSRMESLVTLLSSWHGILTLSTKFQMNDINCYGNMLFERLLHLSHVRLPTKTKKKLIIRKISRQILSIIIIWFVFFLYFFFKNSFIGYSNSKIRFVHFIVWCIMFISTWISTSRFNRNTSFC